MTTRAAFPYALTAGGATAHADAAAALEQLVEQILFVEPGERVNRPDFGCGLRQLVFAGGASELTTAAEAMVHSALRQFAGPAVDVQGIDVAADDDRIDVTVRYLDVAAGQVRQIRVSGP